MTRSLQDDPHAMEWSLMDLPLPIVLRPPRPITDEELMRFSSRNGLYRIEKTAQGDLHIMTPVGGDGSRWEAFVIRELSYWAEDNGGEAFSSNGGFNLRDGSTLSPDTAWVSNERWKLSRKGSAPPFRLCAPTS